jgi:hypothetical protein
MGGGCLRAACTTGPTPFASPAQSLPSDRCRSAGTRKAPRRGPALKRLPDECSDRGQVRALAGPDSRRSGETAIARPDGWTVAAHHCAAGSLRQGRLRHRFSNERLGSRLSSRDRVARQRDMFAASVDEIAPLATTAPSACTATARVPLVPTSSPIRTATRSWSRRSSARCGRAGSLADRSRAGRAPRARPPRAPPLTPRA